MQAICTAGGSLSPFKCQPRTLIASPTSKTFTFGCLLPNATNDAGGSPRTYSSGMVSVIAFAMVRAARTMERHESRYPLYFLSVLSIGNERKMYLVPICCITAQVPAMRAPGLHRKKLACHLRVEASELSYRDPERLGLA